MLLKTILTLSCLICTSLLPVFCKQQMVASASTIRRVTVTSETALNLNPSLSGDGRIVAFESTEDLAASGGHGFHAFRAELLAESTSFVDMTLSRAVAPALSQNGSVIVFASTKD